MRLCNSLLLILSSATGFSSGALYAGSYTCGTPAWLFLHVDEASDERVTAVFHFLYPSSTQNGAYQIRGKYRDAPLPMRRAVQFEPGHWVVTAGKVVRVGLLGILSEDGSTFAGEVLHSSCGSFQLARIGTDELIPPLSTVSLGALATTDALPRVLQLSSDGALGTAAADVSDEGNEDHLDRSWQPRPQVQMLINGVALLIEEARQRRRTPAATPTPSVPPSAQPPVQQPTTQLRPLVGPMPAEEATNAAAGEPALSAAEVDKLRALEPVLRRLIDTRSFDDACTASRLELAQHLPPTKLPMQSCRALASCALCSSRTHLERMISSLAAADKLFAEVGSVAVQRAAAWRVMSSLAATQQLAGGADTNDEKAEHDALRSLSLFVSQVPAAGRALIAVFKVAGAELAVLRKAEQKRATATAEKDADSLRHAPAQLAQRLALERRTQIAEEELDVALKRSGSAEGDARLAAAEWAYANGQNAEAAVLAITQLLPGWSWAWRRLAAMRRERPGGIADAQAVEWLRRATQLAPYDVFAWVELGDMLRAGNDARGALHAYNEAKIRHPTLKALRRLERWMASTVESQAVSRQD